ncbi:MAG: hypothetical protein HUJ58_10100 [Erysipelotrichaceae bacterium]|nr:hypothetical protein [Erysipelotrichaceae bacterium]
MTKKNIDKKDNFSVALGLTDYGNPILYSITSITIITHLSQVMGAPWSWLYILGVIVSLIFGFTIPTVKLLVGLGKIPFSLPVNLVFYVNSGIFLSGLMLIKNVLAIDTTVFLAIIAVSAIFLALVYLKTKKFNNIAVLIGGVGYLLVYISLINKSLSMGNTTPVIFYSVAIALYLLLIGIGVKGNLKDARVHWVIELSNICCQGCVAIGTLILFSVIG